MLYRIISVLIALMFVLPAGSQSWSDNSAVFGQTPVATQAYSQLHQNSRRGIEFPKTRLGRVAVVSAPLIAEGLVAKKLDGRFRGLRNDYIPEFKKSVDDYMQYSPFALMVGLKALGVESRSSWGRMVVSDAFSAVVTKSG